METIAYFLDGKNFEIIDVIELKDYEINQDEETNAKSTMTVLRKINAADKDFVFIKENEKIIFAGIIEAPTIEDKENIEYTINAKYITNLFDRKIILKNQSLISTAGIEDFIAYTIENEFTNSSDKLLNKTFIDIEVLTHTPKNFSVSNDKGIYNFHTFINNCTQNYNITYTFDIVDKRLKITIANTEEEEADLIDSNITDITEYLETFETNVVAKVTVVCANETEHNYYLLNDRTTTTDIDAENRAVGDIEVVYEELEENAREAALNTFRSNSYKHLIQFNVNSESSLYNVKDWIVGKKIKIKNTSNEIIDSYISAITKIKGNPMWSIKTGNIRITLLDKLKQEKLK